MRAVLFEDVGKIALGDYPDPVLQEPTDVVVKVTTTAICGSDLHLLHGRIPGMRPGSVIGHEFVGTVAEAGSEVAAFKVGDQVVGSFLIACGECWFCEHRQFNHCERMWTLGYGLFTGDLDGCQSELVRIPNADLNLHAIEGLDEEQALFAGDILTTGTYITAEAGILPGDTVAITGAGPVGLFALMTARAYSPEVIYMVDRVADRLALAEKLGAVAIDASKVNPVVELQRRTGERGVDVFIECVGAIPAFDTAINAVRKGGTVAVIGVYSELEHSVPIGELWRRGITIKMGGSCNVQGYWDRALDLVRDGTVDPTAIISHTLPLADALRGYEMFERREALKVVLKP